MALAVAKPVLDPFSVWQRKAVKVSEARAVQHTYQRSVARVFRVAGGWCASCGNCRLSLGLLLFLGIAAGVVLKNL